MAAAVCQIAGMEFPGISVIIPVYNYARYLAAAIESALGQDYPCFELIVVDDGSTDDSGIIAQSYGGRLRYIRQANAGLSAARNAGIQAARHPLISLLDADDVWRPGILKRLYETMASLSPDFGLVACLQLNIDENGDMLPVKHARRFERQNVEITAGDILLKTRFGPSCVLVRKACFERAGLFNVELKSSEDREMWIRVAEHHRVFLLAEEFTLVRRHAGNMSKHADRMKQNMGRVLAAAWRRGVRPIWHLCFWAKVFAHFRHETACMYFDEGRISRALADEFISILICPVFLRPSVVNEAPLFRVRHLLLFLRGVIPPPSTIRPCHKK